MSRALLLAFLVALLLFPTAAGAGAPGVVVSQIYGGGGNAGATLRNDYLELFNEGSGTVDLSSWTVQYATTAGTTWQTTALSGTIAPGRYYLVQLASNADVGGALPPADATGTSNLGATSGKIALVRGAAALTCGASAGSCSADPLVEDLVGYGNASDFEGAGSAPGLSNTSAAIRANDGCTDTGNNAADFTAGVPAPRNSASPVHSCGSAPPGPGGSVNVDLNVASVLTVSLDHPSLSFGTFEDLRRRERFRAGGGELHRERQVVETSAELGDLLGRFEPGALAEERDRLGRGERRHLVLDLPLDAQELAARCEQGEVGAALEQSRKLGSGLGHLLQVVEEEEHLPLADVLGEPVLGAQGLRDRLGDESGIAQGGEPNPEDACFVVRDERGRRFEREPSLPRAAGTREGEQARSLGDPGEDFLQLPLPADEGGGRAGKVGVRNRLEGREARVSELVDGNGLGDVFEPVFPEFGERAVDELGCCLGEDGLPTVAGRRKTGGEVHLLAHVPLVAQTRLACVQANPNADRPGGERASHLRSRRERSGSVREGEEEGVSLRVDLDSSLRRAGRTHDPPVLGERFVVRVVSDLLEKLGRAFDIGEEERDSPGGEIAAHERSLARRSRAAKP